MITTIMLGGDVMLGRLVKDFMISNGCDAPLQSIAHLLRRGDLTLINLECAITDSNTLWTGAPKAFYFGADPIAAQALQNAGVDLVSLANNHILDFDYQGLTDTLFHLREKNIAFTGAGNTISEAYKPAIISRNGITFGMVAFCDHQPDFAATADRAGMAYLNLQDENRALRIFEKQLAIMNDANIDWPIISLHWGPNKVDTPSPYFRKLAHQIIDMGYKIIFGHSAHVFHGIEIYRDCPIIYAAGDFVDDYAVGTAFRNDHQLLFELTLKGTELTSIELHPVFIERCQVRLASQEEYSYIAKRAIKLNEELGTRLELSQGADGTRSLSFTFSPT